MIILLLLWYMMLLDVATGTDSRQSSVKKSVNDVAAFGKQMHSFICVVKIFKFTILNLKYLI